MTRPVVLCDACGTRREPIDHAYMWRGRTYTGMACRCCNDVTAPPELLADLSDSKKDGKEAYDWYPETPMGRAAAEDAEYFA
jgi:hypothetical protein